MEVNTNSEPVPSILSAPEATKNTSPSARIPGHVQVHHVGHAFDVEAPGAHLSAEYPSFGGLGLPPVCWWNVCVFWGGVPQKELRIGEGPETTGQPCPNPCPTAHHLPPEISRAPHVGGEEQPGLALRELLQVPVPVLPGPRKASATASGDSTRPLGAPDLRGQNKVTRFFSVVYFSRKTLPKKRGEKGHYWGTWTFLSSERCPPKKLSLTAHLRLGYMEGGSLARSSP